MNKSNTVTVEFDDTIVRYFMLASIFWGAIGMLAGVFIASQLAFWQMNADTQYITFGRLRPLHTNAAIFAFVGNMIFAGVYYSTQRLCKARLPSRFLSWLHFYGWQLIIVAAAITLPLGLTRGKEYAELIWPINVAVVVIWVVFAINFFWLLAIRREPTLYVAIWFYIATIVTVAMLYIVNHLQLPTSLTHGYPIFAGVQDGLVQWWYGHNAVAFFLTTPVLGIMYYFLPKAAERPVYSYRLSVVHFWSLVFVYIWAGPHHLLNTALPQWLQSLGMLFSLMLWAPSWGGMLNGLLTLRGAWDKLRTDPIIKFFIAGVTFYGMATFEGPLMAIPFLNSFTHYTDWTIGHVHGGTLGWNSMMAAGMFYYLAPRLWGRKLYSETLANFHFWTALFGILFYIVAMWIAGVTQSLMLFSTKEAGTVLTYSFIETLNAISRLYHLRLFGGMLFLGGWILLIYNIAMTIRSGEPVNGTIEVPEEREEVPHLSFLTTFINAPVLTFFFTLVFLTIWSFGGTFSLIGFAGAILTLLVAILHMEMSSQTWVDWYDRLLASWIPFTVLTLLAVAIGGLIQIVPTLIVQNAANVEEYREIPFTPLEIAGRDIYVREGCYLCHSQMIRPFTSEVLRYGEYSRLGESIYDHPFQWGSKRIGPDLARVGLGASAPPDSPLSVVKYSDDWHYNHLVNPRSTSNGSIMPDYVWLPVQKIDLESLPSHIDALRTLGVPYPAATPEQIKTQALTQATEISKALAESNSKIKVDPDREIVAVIAYLQKLGHSEKVPEHAAAKTATPYDQP